jgi:hypothetical protein
VSRGDCCAASVRPKRLLNQELRGFVFIRPAISRVSDIKHLVIRFVFQYPSWLRSQTRPSFSLICPDPSHCRLLFWRSQPRQPRYHAFLDSGASPPTGLSGPLFRVPVLRQAATSQRYPKRSLYGSILPDMVDINPVPQAREPHRMGVAQAARAGNTPCPRGNQCVHFAGDKNYIWELGQRHVV